MRININLHDYRYELTKVDIQRRVLKAMAILFGAVVLVGLAWLQEEMQVGAVEEEVRQLEQQIQGLSADFEAVQKIKKQQKRVEAIVGGIHDLRGKQLPATRILADLNFNVPEEIWLTEVSQKTMDQIARQQVPLVFVGDPEKIAPKNLKRGKGGATAYEFIEIVGKAYGTYGDRAVVEYVQYLETIPYFEKVYLHRTAYDTIEGVPVRQFAIYCYIPEERAK